MSPEGMPLNWAVSMALTPGFPALLVWIRVATGFQRSSNGSMARG